MLYSLHKPLVLSKWVCLEQSGLKCSSCMYMVGEMYHKEYGKERHTHTQSQALQCVWNLNGAFASKNVVEETVAKRHQDVGSSSPGVAFYESNHG